MWQRWKRFGQWMEDFRWAMNAIRARRYRRQMLFSRRVRFDAALRPSTSDGAMIAYPDAIYHIRIGDVLRALETAAKNG